MATMISLRDANQGFSRCVREVEAGAEFVITRDGRPVARLVPVGTRRVLTPEQEAARERLRAAMREGWSLGPVTPFDRDALHED